MSAYINSSEFLSQLQMEEEEKREQRIREEREERARDREYGDPRDSSAILQNNPQTYEQFKEEKRAQQLDEARQREEKRERQREHRRGVEEEYERQKQEREPGQQRVRTEEQRRQQSQPDKTGKAARRKEIQEKREMRRQKKLAKVSQHGDVHAQQTQVTSAQPPPAPTTFVPAPSS